MNLDITALDQLPETDPVAIAGFERVGLMTCDGLSCLVSCIKTVTCNITFY